MAEQATPEPSEPGRPPSEQEHPEGDLEYDLAHEGAQTPPEPVEAHEPTQVVTATDDQGEDYSYDLAHDIPPPGHRSRRAQP